LYIVIKLLYLQGELIINGNKEELMIFKELFEGPVGDYCIAHHTIKYFFGQESQSLWFVYIFYQN